MAFRHWILAGAFAVSGAAFAQGMEKEQQKPEMGQQHQREMEQRQEVQQQLTQIYSEKGKKEAFEIKGKVAGFDQQTGAIVLQRENLPPAMLLMTQQTEVKMDGKSSSAQQLQPGSEVRASFNLAQGMPVAISIDAKKPKGEKRQQGGAGMEGVEEPMGGSETGDY
ncbi:MAG: hypothetical protein WBV82_08005 [Myxococcaceae bacterium]